MAEQVSLRDANQRFAKLVKEVESGREFVITRHGRPVARLVPAIDGKRTLTPEQEAARRRSLERMRRGWHLGGERVDRAALYDRD